MVTPTGRCTSSCIRCVLQAGVLVVPATLGSAGAGGGCSGVWAPQGTPWGDPLQLVWPDPALALAVVGVFPRGGLAVTDMYLMNCWKAAL